MFFLYVYYFVYGNLRVSVCFVDNKWMVKVGDWEFFWFLILEDYNVVYLV